jgi:hypothetical protein
MQYNLLDNSEIMDVVDKSRAKEDIEGNRFLLDESENSSCIKSLSNQTVLGVTCLLFFLFVVAEIIGALVSNRLYFLRQV